MSPSDKGENQRQEWSDSIDIGLSPEDLEFVKGVDTAYSHQSFEHFNLNDTAERLLRRLRTVRGSEEIEVFGLTEPEQDAAGILTTSGEAVLYRNNRNRLCIAYNRSVLLEGLLLQG